MFNKPTRSYLFRALVEDARRKHRDMTWTEARLMFKGATVAAVYRAQQEGNARSYGR